jgi:hypothetical protein
MNNKKELKEIKEDLGRYEDLEEVDLEEIVCALASISMDQCENEDTSQEELDLYDDCERLIAAAGIEADKKRDEEEKLSTLEEMRYERYRHLN